MALRNVIPWLRRGPIIPVVRLSGIIASAPSPVRVGMSLHTVERALQHAFAYKPAPEVALAINSPGGAAVQSHIIYKRIRELASKHGKRVLAVVEDVAASGGYMIACAGDEIIVDDGSIVGSIGVISAGFGFQDLIARIGVERRVHTAGRSKAMLDPFQPEREEDVERLKASQEDVHAMFIDLVRSRRPALASDPDLFTGAFWSGRRAVGLGLADRIGDLSGVLRERYGEDVRIRPIPTERGPWWRRRLGMRAGTLDAAGLLDQAVSVIEARLMWGRFGL